ncbi:hypothetical protein MLD38_018144 [Melastoma candidum]|uniref:Uncharacterized protein n=1 Tax=Melastoma candidum TaxID=119954 RepID=A0ACB9QSY3_9MYRT|nr:hypothetical protein MLD38_018144 [Melastoma candidum]
MDRKEEPKHGVYSEEMKSSLRARYSYGILFLLMNVVAWLVRDYGQKFLPELHYLKSCGDGGLACFRTTGVLRVSLGCFIFFFLMFISTYNTRKLYEARNMWHSGWWFPKFILLVLSLAAPVFLPSSIIHLYGELAQVGAGIFLVLQLISVIQFIAWWNKHWMPEGERKRSCTIGLVMSTVFYAAALGGIAAMFKFYAFGQPLNVFFIAWTLILLVVMMAISLHSKVNRGLLSSGIMGSYVVFLCWSAIRSEPAIQKSETRRQANHHDWSTILSFLIGICAIVMATFSTGIDSESFQFRKDTMKLEDDVPYKYEFFHLVFSLGAMYFAMLFICWNLKHSSKKWIIDVGWASTWVKIVNEWLAATIYLWQLISPVVIQVRVSDIEEPQDSRTRISG